MSAPNPETVIRGVLEEVAGPYTPGANRALAALGALLASLAATTAESERQRDLYDGCRDNLRENVGLRDKYHDRAEAAEAALGKAEAEFAVRRRGTCCDERASPARYCGVAGRH